MVWWCVLDSCSSRCVINIILSLHETHHQWWCDGASWTHTVQDAWQTFLFSLYMKASTWNTSSVMVRFGPLRFKMRNKYYSLWNTSSVMVRFGPLRFKMRNKYYSLWNTSSLLVHFGLITTSFKIHNKHSSLSQHENFLILILILAIVTVSDSSSQVIKDGTLCF